MEQFMVLHDLLTSTAGFEWFYKEHFKRRRGGMGGEEEYFLLDGCVMDRERNEIKVSP